MSAKLRLGPVVLLYHRRVAFATVAVLTACLVVLALCVTLGDFTVRLDRVIAVMRGHGTQLERTVVLQWRLARCLVALGVGAALGLAGALTQIIARNGLASPDILGISRGASVAAVTALVLMGSAAVPLAAITGGLVTAGAIWLLARGARRDMYTLLLIGIGVNAGLQAVVVYLLTATDLDTAAAAKVWMIGTVNGRTMEHLWPTLVALSVALVLCVALSTRIPVLSLGTETASALGVHVRRTSTCLLLLAVVLTSLTVAAVGPVGFVAFVAPQIAARLARGETPPLGLATACGALLVAVADLVARCAFPWEVPVGIVTAAIGGPFLLWLLWRSSSVRLA